MTPATVREAAETAIADTGILLCEDLLPKHLDAIASAVLAAADAGETEGPWRVVNEPSDPDVFSYAPPDSTIPRHWWARNEEDRVGPCETEAQAIGVCNVLNRIHGRTA